MSHLSSSTGTPVTKGKAMRVRRPEAKRVNYVFALHYPSSSSCSERAGEQGHKSTLMRSGDRPAKRRREEECKQEWIFAERRCGGEEVKAKGFYCKGELTELTEGVSCPRPTSKDRFQWKCDTPPNICSSAEF